MASEDGRPQKKAKTTTSQWAAFNDQYNPYKYAVGKLNVIRLPLIGYWFRTSAGQGLLKICGTSEGTREAGPVVFNFGQSHGNGTVFLQSSGRAWASIDFHYETQEDDIKPHTLKEVLPGVFQTRDCHTCWICPSRFNPYEATGQEVLAREDNDETSLSNAVSDKLVIACDHLPFCIEKLEHVSGSKVWKIFSWLHGGRECQYLLVMDTFQVVWCSWNGAEYTPEANGEACYCYIKEDLDLWHVQFHCRGVETQAKSHLLVRATSPELSECCLWRSPGNEYKTFLKMAHSRGSFLHVVEAMYDPCSAVSVCMIQMVVKPGLV